MSADRTAGWQAKLSALLFAIFCFELGIFLAIFPWTEYWDHNYFSSIPAQSLDQLPLSQWWRGLWTSPAFRGAITGLGVMNLYIGVSSVLSLRRFAAPVEDRSVSIE